MRFRRATYGAGELEDFIVGAGGEAQLLERGVQQRLGVGGERAKLREVAMAHLRVGKEPGALQPLTLNRPGLEHPLLDGGGGLAVRGLGERVQRDGDFRQVAMHGVRGEDLDARRLRELEEDQGSESVV